MKKDAFIPIDKEFNEVHSLLVWLMECSQAYKLTEEDLNA